MKIQSSHSPFPWFLLLQHLVEPYTVIKTKTLTLVQSCYLNCKFSQISPVSPLMFWLFFVFLITRKIEHLSVIFFFFFFFAICVSSEKYWFKILCPFPLPWIDCLFLMICRGSLKTLLSSHV